MAVNEYEVGDVAVLRATFNVDGTPTSPTALEAEVRKPSGLVSTYHIAPGEIDELSDGVFELKVSTDEEGDWWYEFEGTGAAEGTKRGGFRVVAQRVDVALLDPNALTSIGRARWYVLGDPTNDGQDEILAFLINWASRAIEDYAQREFVPTDDDARTFDWDGSRLLSLAPYELRNVTEVTWSADGGLHNNAIQATGIYRYRPEPAGRTRQGTYLNLAVPPPLQTSSASALAAYYGSGGYTITIDGDWGMAEVPRNVEGACLIMVKDLKMNPGAFRSYNVGPVQIAEGDQASTIPFGSIPPGARRALAPYLRRKQLYSLRFGRQPRARDEMYR
jgi:hypothetical protein